MRFCAIYFSLGLVAAPGIISAPAVASPHIISVERILVGPSPADPFRRPLDLAADGDRGYYVVADSGNRRLVVLDAIGRHRGSLRIAPAPGTTSAAEPRSVALDRRGRVYLIDGVRLGVDVMSSGGSHLAFLEPRLTADVAAACRPQSVAVGSSGRIYLLCAGDRSGLVAMTPTAETVLEIGFEPPEEATFAGPVAIAVDHTERRIAVVDPMAENAVHLFAADGTRLRSFGPHGEGDGTFSMAVHAAWSPDGTLWITDTIRHSVSVFDETGDYLGRVGGFGNGPGQFNYPSACAFLAQDRLLVLERAGARLQILAVESGESGTPLLTANTPAPATPEPLSPIERR